MERSLIETERGITIIRPDLLKTRCRNGHTIIASGASRGGTTALAYALLRGGVNMGPDLPLNLEDDRFVDCIKQKRISRTELSKLLRTSTSERWGFKVPDAVFHLPWLDQNAVNPVFVFILRSPLATANSVLKHDPNFSSDSIGFEHAMRHPLTYYSAIADALPLITAPIVLVDYEHLHFRPKYLLPRLFSALNISSDITEQIASELSQPDYKQL